jgi:hypothetical protein
LSSDHSVTAPANADQGQFPRKTQAARSAPSYGKGIFERHLVEVDHAHTRLFAGHIGNRRLGLRGTGIIGKPALRKSRNFSTKGFSVA